MSYGRWLDLACTWDDYGLTFWRRWENAYLPLDSPLFPLLASSWNGQSVQ